MGDRIKVFALGGLDEDGKNCTVVSINDDLFVINAGIMFPDKTMPGVDYVIPDFSYLKEHAKDIKGYFLLHGHDDEIGALAYLYEEAPAPIYGSLVTITMFKNFIAHVRKNIRLDAHIVNPTATFKVAGRDISFFQTSHNIAMSSGIAISTDKGNIVFTGDFVIENNANASYLHDVEALSVLSKQKTLLLMTESIYANRLGYTAPNYKLTPLIEEEFKNAPGRIFISIFSPNLYNIDEAIQLAISNNRKVIPYDEETQEVLTQMQSCGQLLIPRNNYAPLGDINRLRAQDIVILMLGYGVKLYAKMGLLADGQSESLQKIYLNENDTFIVASPSNSNIEIEATDALDQIYRSGCRVCNVDKKKFLKMHASEEDLKFLISLLRPKYYLPVKGFFRDLLDNAQLALSMGIHLNHSNVFILENGQPLVIDDAGARFGTETIPHDSIMIDGLGVGDVSEQVVKDRALLAQGLVILAATLSKSQCKVIAGPEVQVRGMTMLKETDLIVRDATRNFTQVLSEGMESGVYDLDELKEMSAERVRRALRRQSGQEPMVLPLIIEVQ